MTIENQSSKIEKPYKPLTNFELKTTLFHKVIHGGTLSYLVYKYIEENNHPPAYLVFAAALVPMLLLSVKSVRRHLHWLLPNDQKPVNGIEIKKQNNE